MQYFLYVVKKGKSKCPFLDSGVSLGVLPQDLQIFLLQPFFRVCVIQNKGKKFVFGKTEFATRK